MRTARFKQVSMDSRVFKCVGDLSFKSVTLSGMIAQAKEKGYTSYTVLIAYPKRSFWPFGKTRVAWDESSGYNLLVT